MLSKNENMIRKTLLASLCLIILISVNGQSQTKTLAERLGYPANTKLIIVHADDLGMSHSVNEASIKAFATGLVNSGSIMIPCSWLPEITTYAKANPQADLGLHLTLTSEWRDYRWRPILPSGNVSSLLDASGYLYLTEEQASTNIKVQEAESEIRAQVERARKLGIQPTHLDSHMGTLYQTKELFEALMRVARENKLPVRVARGMYGRMPFLNDLLKPEDIVLDNIVSIDQSVKSDDWTKYYTDALTNLPSGVTEFVIHLAHDDNEMNAITVNHPNWGAAWRQRDFDFFTSDTFRKLLEANQIKLITWRDLRKAQYGY